jgi:transcriptional regulator with XRE-family HTH domain
MNYREEIGAELQTLRVQRGLTVRELAEASGVHYSNIAKIENGRYNVSVDILGKVADALGYKLVFEERGNNPFC